MSDHATQLRALWADLPAKVAGVPEGRISVLTEAADALDAQAATIATLTAQRDNSWALTSEIEAALNDAGVSDAVDTRRMIQVSEDEYEEDGEYRQADPLERVNYLIGDRNGLRADLAAERERSARMARVLEALADTCDIADTAAMTVGSGPSAIVAVLERAAGVGPLSAWSDVSRGLRALAGVTP